MNKLIANSDTFLLDRNVSNLKLEFSICNTSFAQKLTDGQIKKLQFTKVTGDIQYLLNHSCSGKPFCCGTYNDNHRAIANFISQQILCLDFDGKMSLEDAKRLLDDYHIPFHGGYYTYSHSQNEERFRLLFILNGKVRSSELIKYILTGFYHFFSGKVDSHCLEAARYWNGTDKSQFAGTSPFALDMFSLLEVLTPVMLAKDRNRWRNIVRTDRIYLLEEKENLIYNYSNNHFCTDEDIIEKKELIQNFDLKDLYHFRIFKIFLEGKGTDTKGNKLCHHELLGIATNLIYVKGGAKIWKNALLKNGNYSRDKESLFSYVKHNNYKPYNVKYFSPFEEDCESFFQTIPQLLTKRGQVIKLKNEQKPLVSLECAREKLKLAYQQIINSNDCKVYLLKAPAGLGKSSLLKNTKNAVIAFPTHNLKDEHFSSSDLPEDYRLFTPDINEFTDVIKKQFENLYKSGFNDTVFTFIKNLSEGKSTTGKKCSEQDTIAANAYLNQLKRAKETKEATVFTTHQRALKATFEQSTIIYDENPLGTFSQLGSIDLNQLTKLIGAVYMTGSKKNADILMSIKDAKQGTVKNTQFLSFDIEEISTILKKQKIKGNILGLLKSTYYVKYGEKIHFCINGMSQIPIDKKIIIADATPPLEVYKRIFGDRLVVFELDNVELKGKIIQYTAYSNSKSGLEKYEHVTNEALDDAVVISYKDKSMTFENSSDEVYWGKVSGTNSLEGDNLNVVGTLHYGLPYYVFLSKYTGLNCKNFKMTYQEVIYNNLLFKFPAFDDEQLQKIQLEIIEGNSLQAVHRARPITHDVVVKLYSNLPIQGAEYIWWDL